MSKSVIIPTNSCFSAHHHASGLLPPGILAPASPQDLSPPFPAPLLPHRFPRDRSSPGVIPVPQIGHSTLNLRHQPLPMPRHHPPRLSDHPTALQSAAKPTGLVPLGDRCAQPSLSRSRALPAGGDYGSAQLSGTRMCVRTAGLCKRCAQERAAREHPHR